MYLGNNLQVAFPSYTNIDDISGSFNGATTSFPLTVNGSSPVPFPLSSNQCLISVNGVVQRPDDSGTEGFRLSGGNIIFSSAPGSGQDFFGVILAGADYVNVGATYPSGSSAVPSITFDSDLDTGLYNPGANQLGISCGTTTSAIFTATGYSFLAGSAASPGLYPADDTNTGLYSPGADQVGIATGGTLRLSLSTTAITPTLPFLSPLGSNSAPSYSFTGDTNTGLYSPGADQVGLTTGGTDRLTIDSSGNVAIDTNVLYVDAANNRVGVGTAFPAANTKFDLSGTYAANITAVANLDIDCSTANYFTKTINANSTFTFSNVPSSRAYSFTLEVDVTGSSTAITWPASVKWPDDTAPSLTDTKTHLFMFVTNDGGTTWRGAALVDYTT